LREIKFRAWDKMTNTWERDFYISLNGDVLRDESMLSHNSVVDITHYVELMQYTGLKDTNGKEIYEGDIVKHDYENFHGVVVYERAMYMVKEQFTWVDKGVYDQNKEIERTWSLLPFYKVTGNRWENPELLEEK